MDIKKLPGLRAELEEVHRAFKGQCEEAEALYDGNIQFSVPKILGVQKHVPPTGRGKIDTLASHSITVHPAVAVPPVKQTKGAEEIAGALEEGYTALLQAQNSQFPVPPWREMGKAAFLYGLGVFKGPLPDLLYAEPPKKRRGERVDRYALRLRLWEMRKRNRLPIVGYPIKPHQVLFDPDNWPPRYVLEIGKRRASWVKANYPNVPLAEDAKDVEWLEYWDEEERHYFIQTEKEIYPAKSTENIYGFIPYVFASSGRGRISDKIEERFVGILTPAADTLKAQARMRTAAETMIEKSVYGFFYVEDTGDPNKIQFPDGPAGIAVVPAGMTIREWPKVDIPPDLWRELMTIERDVDAFMGPASLQGVRTPGTTSGYQEASLIGQGRLEVKSAIDSLNAAGGRYLTNVGRLIEVMDEKIEVWGTNFSDKVYRVLDPKNAGDHVVYVSFEPSPPEEADRRAQLGLVLFQNKAISQRYFLQHYLKMVNVSKEMREIMIEEALRDPVVRQALATEAVADWGLPPELLAQLSQSQAGMPGPGGGQRGGSTAQTITEQSGRELQRLNLGQGELLSRPEVAR